MKTAQALGKFCLFIYCRMGGDILFISFLFCHFLSFTFFIYFLLLFDLLHNYLVMHRLDIGHYQKKQCGEVL